jgi:penicillin amidase
MAVKVGRIAAAVAGGTGAVVSVALILAFLYLRTSLPQVSGSIAIGAEAGLSEAAEIFRDRFGVPHIRAGTPADAYVALGFVHAQDRLWQMETMRRTGAGRLSEILGESLLPTDRLMRTLGLYRLAERQVDRLLPETRQALEAYARGVNAFLARRDGALPPEFVLLGHEPEPWRPADSLVWGKLMALRLARNWQDELLRARLAPRLSPGQLADLWALPPEARRDIAAAIPAAAGLDALAAVLPAPWNEAARGASNGWIVSGTLSTSTRPLLANDPHLAFEAPLPWYLARIETPDLALTGATVPGVPFHVLGHNGRIAWGMTSAEADIADLFVERPDPADAARYLTPDGGRPFETREEVVKVRGEPDSVLAVRETRHGPVVSDLAGHSLPDGSVLALSATFLREGDLTPQALHAINRAGDWQAFRAAAADLHTPPLSLLFADVAGTMARQVAGKIPVRADGHGWMPRPGWTGEADWTGFLPFRDLPMRENPTEGRLVSANQGLHPEGASLFISDDWDPGYRARRIRGLLEESPAHSLDTFANIQRDHLSLLARDLLPRLTRIKPKDHMGQQAVALLSHWNGSMSARRPEPLIFAAWLRELNRMLYADETGDLFPAVWDLRPGFLIKALNEETQAWCDDIGTPETIEDCDGRIELALRRATEDLAERFGKGLPNWHWGKAHMAHFDHRLFSLLAPVGISAETDGGEDTVNRGSFRVADPEHPFRHVHGPGLRALYDLMDLDRSRFILATGQSGNPLSSHYGDMLPEWRDGRYVRLGLLWGDLERNGEGKLTLTP